MSREDPSQRGSGASRAVHGVLAAISALCVLAIVFLYVRWKRPTPPGDRLTGAITLALPFGVLDVVAIVWLFLWLFRSSKREFSDGTVPAVRILSMLLLGGFLAVAVIIFFAATCGGVNYMMTSQPQAAPPPRDFSR